MLLVILTLKSNPKKPTFHFFGKDSCENWEFKESNGESITGIGLNADTNFSSAVAKDGASDSGGSRLQGTARIMMEMFEVSSVFLNFLLIHVVACAGWDEEL